MTSPIVQEFLQHTTALRALARALVGDAHADDVVQEAAIQTMTAPPKRPGPAGGWLASVVRNVAGKQRRAERTRRRHEAAAIAADRADVAPADRSAEDADTLRRLTEIVTSLPEPYRGTILARYLRGQTPNEIAAATGTPVRTVKTRLARGLEMLRERLQERAADWRPQLVGAFALDPAVATNGPTLIGLTMKITILAAALLPVGIWALGGFSAPERTDTASAPVLTATTGDSGPQPAAAASNVDAGGVDTETSGRDDGSQGGATVGAATPSATSPRAAPAVEPPLMRLDVVGPAAFRRAFARTNIGGLVASPEGEALWRPLLAPAEHIWRQWDGRGAEFAAARERVLDYAGRIRVLWMLERGDDGERSHLFGVFALDTDGATDMGALTGDLSRIMRAVIPGDPTEQSAAGHALRLLGDASAEYVTIPVIIDGRLVAFFGEAASLDKTVPRCLAALAAADDPPPAPISFQIDLSQLGDLARDEEGRTFARLLGLASLRSFRASVLPRDIHAELELELAFGEGNRGLWNGILPAVQTLPKLLARVPKEATPWIALPFRPDVMYRWGLEIAGEAENAESPDTETLRQRMHEDLGLHLDTELLDHLAGEIMILGDLWNAEDTEAFRRGDSPTLGACIALSLADTRAFAGGFRKLMDHLKGTVREHETREVDGVKITRLGTVFLTGMHMAMGQDLAAMAFGEEGVAQLEALVAGGRQAPGEKQLPAAIERVRHRAPAGWNGLGLVDLTALFGGQVTLVMELIEDALPGNSGLDATAGDTQEKLDALLPLVKQHGLEDIVVMTGHDGENWRLRVVW